MHAFRHSIRNPKRSCLIFAGWLSSASSKSSTEYVDRISGAKAKRPALDQLLAAAHRREFDVVLVWAADRLARSVRHFLEVLDTLNHLGIEFVSFRENLDTGGPLGQGGRRDRIGRRRAGAQSDHRAGSRRTQACQARRAEASDVGPLKSIERLCFATEPAG